MKYLCLFCLLGSLHAFANIFEEDEAQNFLTQSDMNQVATELKSLEKDSALSQVYNPLPTPVKDFDEEKIEEKKLVAESDEIASEEKSDEIKRKEAAIMKDIEDHAKPVEEGKKEKQEEAFEKKLRTRSR